MILLGGNGPRHSRLRLQFLCHIHLRYTTRSLQEEEISYTVKVSSNLISLVKDRFNLVKSVKECSFLGQSLENSNKMAQAGRVEQLSVIREY